MMTARRQSERAAAPANRTNLRAVEGPVLRPASPPPDLDSAPRRKALFERLTYAWNHWVSRSLLVGAGATCLDVLVLLACVKGIGLPNPVGAMVGVLFGGTFTFFANRHFAFTDHHPELAPQALKFGLATSGAMLVHAYLVHLFADKLAVPVVLAKLSADVLVFTVGQLLVLRFVVFPKAPPEPVAAVESELHG